MFVIVSEGNLTDEDVVIPNRACYADERFMRMRRQLADYRQVESFSVSSEAVQNAARSDAEAARRNPHVRVAIVVTAQVGFGLARMYENAGGETPWQTGIFQTMAEAEAWFASAPDANIDDD